MPEDIFPALRQIILDAAQQSPGMLARNLELLIEDGNLVQAKAAYYPYVGGSYSKNKSKDVRADTPGSLSTDKVYYNFSINQSIYHWGAVKNTVLIGKIRRQIADENFGEARRLLTQEIRSMYLSLVLNKISLRNAIYSQNAAEEKLVVDEERLAGKVISEGSIFPTRIAVAQARLGQETAQWNYQVAKQDFSILTGQPELSDDQIPDEIPALNISGDAVVQMLAQFLAQKQVETFSARIYRQQIEIDDLNHKIQRTRLLPKLNLVAGISQDEQSYTTNIAQRYALQSQYIGLQISWSIFDGFASRGAVASALASKRLDEHNYRAYTDKLALDAKKAAKNVELAQRQLVISELLLKSAEDGLDYTKENFNRGQAAEAEVNNSQANFNSLQSSTNFARLSYMLRLSEFVSLIGNDSNARIVNDN